MSRILWPYTNLWTKAGPGFHSNSTLLSAGRCGTGRPMWKSPSITNKKHSVRMLWAEVEAVTESLSLPWRVDHPLSTSSTPPFFRTGLQQRTSEYLSLGSPWIKIICTALAMPPQMRPLRLDISTGWGIWQSGGGASATGMDPVVS